MKILYAIIFKKDAIIATELCFIPDSELSRLATRVVLIRLKKKMLELNILDKEDLSFLKSGISNEETLAFLHRKLELLKYRKFNITPSAGWELFLDAQERNNFKYTERERKFWVGLFCRVYDVMGHIETLMRNS